MANVIVDLTATEACELLSSVSQWSQKLERHCTEKPQDDEAREMLLTTCSLASKLGTALRRAFPA